MTCRVVVSNPAPSPSSPSGAATLRRDGGSVPAALIQFPRRGQTAGAEGCRDGAPEVPATPTDTPGESQHPTTAASETGDQRASVNAEPGVRRHARRDGRQRRLSSIHDKGFS